MIITMVILMTVKKLVTVLQYHPEVSNAGHNHHQDFLNDRVEDIVRDGGSTALNIACKIVYTVSSIKTALHCINSSSMYAFAYTVRKGWNAIGMG